MGVCYPEIDTTKARDLNLQYVLVKTSAYQENTDWFSHFRSMLEILYKQGLTAFVCVHIHFNTHINCQTRLLVPKLNNKISYWAAWLAHIQILQQTVLSISSRLETFQSIYRKPFQASWDFVTLYLERSMLFTVLNLHEADMNDNISGVLDM